MTIVRRNTPRNPLRRNCPRNILRRYIVFPMNSGLGAEFDRKWRSHVKDGAKDKRKEPAPEVVPDDGDVRPPGVKASKAGKRRKHGNEADFDRLESLLAMKNMYSKQKILDRLLAKSEETLSSQEKKLKTNLIGEML
uniref:No apical meristem-associated C-terminal domain-containing protein n=1 Tax=Brassica oleracea var. oleracea TaxID=109376 RepID=A0A0D3B3C7_BRAOL